MANNLPKFKMVAVTVRCQGITSQAFVWGMVGADGKVRITPEALNKVVDALGIHTRGMTMSFG